MHFAHCQRKVQSHSMHIPFGKIASFRHWNCPYVNLSPFGCRAFVRMFHLRRRQRNNHFYDFMPHRSAHTHEFLSSSANAFGELADASRNTIIEVEIYFMFCSATWVCTVQLLVLRSSSFRCHNFLSAYVGRWSYFCGNCDSKAKTCNAFCGASQFASSPMIHY